MTFFNKNPVTVIRRVPGEYVNGEYVDGAASTFPIRASVQPIDGKLMESLPEGRRTKENIRLNTVTKLQAAESYGAGADLVQIKGVYYEVYSVKEWDNGLLPHFKAYCSRLESQSTGTTLSLTGANGTTFKLQLTA